MDLSRAARLPGLVFLLAAAGGACAEKPTGTLILSLGGETDTLTREPRPSRLVVEAVALDGKATELASARLPTETVSLGDLETTRVAALRVTGIDDGGTVRVRGLSFPVEFGALAGTSLTIFVQRTSELARMPAPLGDGREDPVAVSVAGRFLIVTGGAGENAKGGSLYDLAFLRSYAFPTTLPRVPASLAASDVRLLVIDGAGASWVGLESFDATDALAPAGGTFAEIAGGATVDAESGVSYVVGATRASGEPTARVLRIGASGALSFVTLAHPRLGAAATWVNGRGLVVSGGNAEAPGAEIIGPTAITGVPLPFPPRSITGASAIPLADGKVVLAGGLDPTGAAAPTELLDLACASACAARPWSTPLPVPLARAEGFGLPASEALVVGTAVDGASHVFRLGETTVTDVPLRIPRRKARARLLASGSIAVVGGAQAVESYAP